MSEEEQILVIMSKSSLQDIPWPLITPEQIAAVLRGEKVEPTPMQKLRARQLNGEKKR